jgi:hypothetical protein
MPAECLEGLRRGGGSEIGFDKPLGDYSEPEALQRDRRHRHLLVTNAMAAHHEMAKYPPVRGMPPTPRPVDSRCGESVRGFQR